MKRILNFRDFNVFSLEKEVWDIDYHNHNFYEIILVEKGRGKHRLNNIVFSYKKGDVFLLTPSDAHEFVIEKKTTFIYIKFTEQFALNNLLWLQQSNAKEQIRLLLIHKPVVSGSIIESGIDTIQIFQLAKIVLNEFSTKNAFEEDLVSQLFSSILLIMARNLVRMSDHKDWIATEGERIDKILSYISVFATDKQKMKIENMAAEFLMSKNYISSYVKAHTGMSIQSHALQFKLKAAEKLLSQSKFNINEIAEKLAFTDASHFNKMFKKHSNMSPIEFRTQVRQKSE